MPALGGVQVFGPNGAMSNNLVLPTAGLQNFVPDPSTLVSTNYFTLPAPNGLPMMGPGTTNFPGITLGPNYANPGNSNFASFVGGSPPSGSPDFVSITKPYKPEDRGRKRMYAEELKRQMVEKDIRNEAERRKNEEWDEWNERRVANDYQVTLPLSSRLTIF